MLLCPVVAFRFAGEIVAFDIGAVAVDRIRDQCRGIAIPAHEFRWRGKGQIDEIVQHQDLAIAVRPGANANGRDVESGGYALRHFRRNSFQHYGESPRYFQGQRIFHQMMDGGKRLALDPVAAHAVDGLRGKRRVCHYRDLCFREPLDKIKPARSAFDLSLPARRLP